MFMQTPCLLGFMPPKTPDMVRRAQLFSLQDLVPTSEIILPSFNLCLSEAFLQPHLGA